MLHRFTLCRNTLCHVAMRCKRCNVAMRSEVNRKPPYLEWQEEGTNFLALGPYWVQVSSLPFGAGGKGLGFGGIEPQTPLLAFRPIGEPLSNIGHHAARGIVRCHGHGASCNDRRIGKGLGGVGH